MNNEKCQSGAAVVSEWHSFKLNAVYERKCVNKLLYAIQYVSNKYYFNKYFILFRLFTNHYFQFGNADIENDVEFPLFVFIKIET